MVYNQSVVLGVGGGKLGGVYIPGSGRRGTRGQSCREGACHCLSPAPLPPLSVRW